MILSVSRIALSLACAFLAVALTFARPQANAPPIRFEGTVKDQTGAVIAGARVELRSGQFRAQQATGSDGRFEFDSVPIRSGTLTVSAAGFTTSERTWRAGEPTPLVITLEPAGLLQKITVTATRVPTRLSETPANVTVLTSQDVATTAALELDDVLRQVPGFSLFRRSGSRTANPTTQGVSLRGVGASGAGRALVLADGIPLNDPFGGWVYWDRIPRASVNRIEVLRGGASDLYGTSAMGGVVNILTRRASRPAFSLDTSYGNENTPDASFWGGVVAGRWRIDMGAEAMHTRGYILVDPAERGSVDTPAGSEHETAQLRVERQAFGNGKVFAEAAIFRETRTNGTPLQTNRTHLRQAALGGDWQSEKLGTASLRIYGGPQLYDQTFSAIAPDRTSESLTRIQRVPAQQGGISAQWSRTAGAHQTLLAGFEDREVRGASDETGFFSGVATTATGAGGRQRTVSVFGEDILRLSPRWITTLGLRLDQWRNFDALSSTRPLSTPGPVTVTNFAPRSESALSPRLASLYRVTENVSLTASFYRAFRAPTLNELYRGFRVGNIVTRANSDLKAEHLTGAEAGAELNLRQKLTARGVFFWNDVTRPIANVTLAVTPDLITRQRQNLGRTRAHGFDLDLTARLTQQFDVSAGYEFADAAVVSFSANPALVGLRVPQVPRNVFTFQARYDNSRGKNPLSRWTLAFQGRFAGLQYEDDQNLLPLGRYFTLDALLARPLGHGVEAYVAAENMFNDRYAVGRTPVLTLGPPVLVRSGIRLSWGAR